MGSSQSNLQVETRDVKQVYEFLEVLGKGSFAVVHRARKLVDGYFYAIKVIRKRDLNVEELENVQEEVAIMGKIDHPNVVKLFEIYETTQKVYLVMELLEGGELFERIIAKKHFTEATAAHVIRDISSAIAYLHEHGIVHRDLKPENLLFKDNSDIATIKITDFGLAKYVGDSMHSKGAGNTAVGTSQYLAPEVITSRMYGPEGDVWAIGVILYILLSGFPPFYEEDINLLYDQILKATVDFSDPSWLSVSNDAKRLISSLLVVEPSKRFTAKEILAFNWTDPNYNHQIVELKLNVLDKIRSCQAKMRLHKAMKAVLATERLKLLVSQKALSSPSLSPDSSFELSPRSPFLKAPRPLDVGIFSSEISNHLSSIESFMKPLSKPAPMNLLLSPSSFASDQGDRVTPHPKDALSFKMQVPNVKLDAFPAPKSARSYHPASPTTPSVTIMKKYLNLGYDTPLTESELKEEIDRKERLRALSLTKTEERISRFDFR